MTKANAIMGFTLMSLFLVVPFSVGLISKIASKDPTEIEVVEKDPAPKIEKGWIKHDPKDCKFVFSEDVQITKGLYRGSKGAILDLRDDGYVVDIYAYKIAKPNGKVEDRSCIIYGVPESDLEVLRKKGN